MQKYEKYRGFRGAGKRLSEEPIPSIGQHSSELELPLLYAYHMFDKAHLVMMTEENIIPREDGVKMLKALREMEAEGLEKVRLRAEGGMHSAEYYLIGKLSEEVGGKINLGRSSADLSEVAFKVKQRDRLLRVMEEVNNFRNVLFKVAREHTDTIMPAMTHAQHGQPTALGHLFLSWASVLERDFERLEEVYQRVNMSPAGAAIMTGSNFPVNRWRTAELLGFDSPLKNTHDAIPHHDVLIEVMAVLAILSANLGRWADDIILWFTPEFGLIDIPDRFCGTSSIMMQLKFPEVMEHVKGSFSYTVGSLVTAFMVEKKPTGFSVLDHYYVTNALWKAFDDAIRNLNWFKELIASIKVNRGLMKERAGAFWAQATDVAGALVREKGLSWRTAHQIVAILVRLSYERGLKPQDVDTELLDEAARQYMNKPVGLSPKSLKKALNPVEFVKGRTLYGGPAPEEMLRRIPDFQERLEQDRKKLDMRQKKLREAAQKLEDAINTLIS